jgi:hypothetical protein
MAECSHYHRRLQHHLRECAALPAASRCLSDLMSRQDLVGAVVMVGGEWMCWSCSLLSARQLAGTSCSHENPPQPSATSASRSSRRCKHNKANIHSTPISTNSQHNSAFSKILRRQIRLKQEQCLPKGPRRTARLVQAHQESRLPNPSLYNTQITLQHRIQPQPSEFRS